MFKAVQFLAVWIGMIVAFVAILSAFTGLASYVNLFIEYVHQYVTPELNLIFASIALVVVFLGAIAYDVIYGDEDE